MVSSWGGYKHDMPNVLSQIPGTGTCRLKFQGIKAVNDEGSDVNVVVDIGIEVQFLDCASING